MSAIGISLSGLQASMARLTASASNIANAQSAGRLPSPDAAGPAPYQPVRARQSDVAGGGVTSRFEAVTPGFVPGYDPASPLADAHGMVALPNVDLTDELVEMLAARIAFQANAKMLGTVHDLERRSIDILA
jgi:flagellar basal-body rod protein FlgC